MPPITLLAVANTFLLIGTTVLVSAVAAILIANLVMFSRNLRYQVADLPALDEPEFLRSAVKLLELNLCPGNRVEVLLNGEEAFSAMFRAVEHAKRSITFENYIYWSGRVGSDFAQLLAEKARQGVQVSVLVDWVGAFQMDRAYLRLMRKAGVEIHRYHPPQRHSLHRFNQRTHRRELVVDGRIGFTGGVGFGDVWRGDGKNGWRDNHYRIEGPLVAEMQSIFLDNWLTASGQVLHGDAYFPALEPCGDQMAGLIRSRPRERITAARLSVLMLLRAARRSVHLEQSYFVPDRSLLDALTAALRRGVRVEIILPNEKLDYPFVRWASRARWGALLKAGAKIYEYQPAMLHVKTVVLDEQWVLTGSANLDYRSFYRNDEILLGVFDQGLARRHLEIFENDRQRSCLVTLEQWQNRPAQEKILDFAASLIRTQL